MSDNGDVNDFGNAEEPEADVGEDPFGGSDLEPVTDEEEDDDDDGEDLLENQEMCAIGPVFYSWHPSRLGHAPRAASRPRGLPKAATDFERLPCCIFLNHSQLRPRQGLPPDAPPRSVRGGRDRGGS